MKIVHLCISGFFVDNYSYQENLLTKYHVKMGHDVTIIASLQIFDDKGHYSYLEGPSEYVNSDGVKVIRIDYKRPFYKLSKFLLCYEGLYDALENEHPDIIFTHNIMAVGMHQLARYMKCHPQTRLFGDNHMDYVNSITKSKHIKHIIRLSLWKYCVKEIEPYLIKCYGVTPMRCRFLKEICHVNPAKVDFLPMGVDDEALPSDKEKVRKEMRLEMGIGENDFLIFSGGKIDKLKNTDVLLQTLEKLSNPKIHLIICGVITPEMEFLHEVIKANKNIITYISSP